MPISTQGISRTDSTDEGNRAAKSETSTERIGMVSLPSSSGDDELVSPSTTREL